MRARSVPRRVAGGLVAGVVFALALQSAGAWAQTANFDDRPSGFLSARTGGMPADGWKGTTLGTAKHLVSALPAAPRSRALRDLQFKVMVSDLQPPGNDGSALPSLFARKVERLAAMGEGESLNEMVRGAGGFVDPFIATTVANALMLAGERDGGCAVVRGSPMTEPFGRRADIACRVVNSDIGGAQAAVAALRGSDPAFALLVDQATGVVQPGPATLTAIDGPAMMMLDVAFVSPPPAILRSTQPSLMRSLVALKSLPLPTRLDVAERGEMLAIVEATRLGDLYVEAVRDRVPLPQGMARRAQLVAQARNAASPADVMSSVSTIYSEMRGNPLFSTVARASAVGLLNLPAQPQYANIAQEAIRGFLLLGDKQLTQAWTKLAVNAAYNNARAMNALDRLMPLIAIAGIDNPRSLPAEEVNRWFDVMRQDDPQRAGLRGNLLLELFRATGIDIPARGTELPEAPPANARLVSLPPATLQALQSAGQGRRRAEAALLATAAVGETPLVDLHPASVGAIVRALREVGEDQAARLFAIETAIAHGL